MRISRFALHASFIRSLNRASAEAEFREVQRAHPELAGFASTASLLERQQAPEADRTTRFAVIRALVAAAQSDRRYRSTAQVMVIVALWPGLDAMFWRLSRGFPSARDDLSAEILSRAIEAILTLDLEKDTAVTATLLRNLERDFRRELIADRVIAEAARPIDDPTVEALVSVLEVPGTFEVQPIGDHMVELPSRDADFLKRIFLLGETQDEAGRAFGLRPAAARKRVQRALKSLRSPRNIPPAVSHSGSPVGLWHSEGSSRRRRMDSDQDDYEKLPGYFRAWDLAQEIMGGRRCRVEDVGLMTDGGALFAVYVAVAPGVC